MVELSKRPLGYALQVACIALLYFAAAEIGLSLASVARQVSPVWPPTGIALAVVWGLGARSWPGVFLGAFAANVLTSAPLPTVAGIATGNTLEALLGAWVLQRSGFRSGFEGLSDVRSLVLAGLASTPVSATLGVACLCLGGVQSWHAAPALWWTWWIGDTGGDWLVAPLLLAWSPRPLLSWGGRPLEAAALLAVLGAVAVSTFAVAPDPERIFPREYMLLPIVIWAALRFGAVVVSAATLIVGALAIAGTVRGLGPFATVSTNQSLLLLEVFLWILAATGLLMGASIRERKRLEEELRGQTEQQAEEHRRKDEFLAMLAHELRNPLAPIATALEVMKRRGGDAFPKERAMIERQVQHLVRLVGDLLDVARITRGKIEIRKAPLDLRAVVAEAVEVNRGLIESRQQKLALSLPDEPLPVDADAVRLHQVIANVVNNAAKYTGEGDRIWVSAAREGDVAAVRIRDDGVGMAPELLARVFDPFVQGERGLDRSQGGLGIGLTLARRLVELHGGSIGARSGGAGQGTEVVIELPLAEHGSRPGTPASSAATHSAPRRILIVDDNADVADGLGELLRQRGHDVRIAHDGPSCLALAAEYRPEVVLLDIGLPGMDGYEVARRLRARGERRDLRIIAVTGYHAPEFLARAREAGCDAHLLKPLDWSALDPLLA